MQMYPVMYPGPQDQEQNRGAGLYAVPFDPHMRLIAGSPPTTLIPLTYSIPTRRAQEAGAAGEENGQMGQQQQQQQQQQQNVHQQPQHQRVVVRRFQIAIQLDLLLILKLAAVIFLFNQDGSRQRLIVLIFFASLVYLYQTGALSPLVRWLSQGMQRAAQPPHPPRPAAVAGGLVPPAPGQVNEDRGLAGEGQDGAEIENDENRAAAENENAPEPAAANNQLWAIVKEIQMIVFGFIASLLPGFHNID